MTVQVKLQDIIEGLEFQSDERFSYLNTATGEVVAITDEELRAAEDNEPLDAFSKICAFAYRLIAVLQRREQMRCRVFQVLSDGIHDFIEGIIRSGINIQMQVVGCQPDDIDCRLLKGEDCFSDQVRHRLKMFPGKDLGSLSGTEHDMVPDRKGNQVRIDAQLLHRVCSEPLLLWGHADRVSEHLFHR